MTGAVRRVLAGLALRGLPAAAWPLLRAVPWPLLRRAPWPIVAAVPAVLLCPLFLLHGRGLAEAMIAVVGAAFLARSAQTRDWTWLRTGWVRVGLLWWGWLVLCSVPVGGLGQGGWPSLWQAVATGRFLLFVAALEHWALRAGWLRRWLARLVALAGLYIALQSALQALVGRNLYGWPRWGDGSLTGPYREPRAGPPMSRLLFPAMLPRAAAWWARGRPLAAGLLALGGMAIMVLIGQRMPLLLTGLGLVVSGLLLPRLRLVVGACLLLAALLVPATAVLSPPTFSHLVVRFSQQMRDFPGSPYGQIAARALAIARADPLTGRGFDGFRTGCPDPAVFQGWRGGDGGGAAICVQHPHNHYLQALTDGGVPGLALFCALVLAWLRGLGRGLWRGAGGPGGRGWRRLLPAAAPGEAGAEALHALRVGLFVAALVQEWPIASASSFTSMPLGGWFFLLLGLGLAEGRAYMGRAV